MNYVVFDLEWNQGWNSNDDGNPLPFEIIEIGAVKLDGGMNEISRFHEIIKPVVYPKLYRHTKKVIALTQSDLRHGRDFRSVAREFLSWCEGDGDGFIFCTWGSSDLYELQRNLDYFGIYSGFTKPLTYCDLQLIFEMTHDAGSGQTHSLESASVLLGVEEDYGQFHSAISDALYTAEILKRTDQELIKNYPSADIYLYPMTEEEEIFLSYPGHTLYVSRAFETKEELRQTLQALPIRCPECEKKARRILPWFSGDAKTSYAVAECRKHGTMRCKRIVKSPDADHHFEVRTIRLVPMESAMRLIEKYNRRQGRH